jgi:uncharacterized membrane protein HdeD (DUF308 family)
LGFFSQRVTYLYFTFLFLLWLFFKQIISGLASFRKWFDSFSGYILRFCLPPLILAPSLFLEAEIGVYAFPCVLAWPLVFTGSNNCEAYQKTTIKLFPAIRIVFIYRILSNLYISAM